MLSPGEERTIDLSSQQKSKIPVEANWATVKLNYSGRRADLVAVAVSYDKDNRYGLQTPFSESVSRMWAGGMWHVDPTHNTFITTGNAGSESTAAEATLFYNGGKSKYRVEKMLSPGQQLWLDVGRLIRDQVPDSDGHTMPPDTMAGSYELRDLDHATVGFLYEGKLIIDKTYGHASYGCATCCGYTIAQLIPDPFDGPPQIDYTEVMQSTQQCGGQVVDLADDGFNWQSSDPSVATLPTKVLHTVAVGSATGSGEVTVQNTHPAPRCPIITYAPTQPVSVGQAMTLVGTNCNANPTFSYGGNYSSKTDSTCFLSSPVAVPSGGSCIECGTLPGGGDKMCYQTNVNGCSTTYSMINTRAANSACTAFIDLGGFTASKVPAGCN